MARAPSRQSRTYTTIQEWFADGATIQGVYHMTDLNLRYAASADRWAAGLPVSNLGDKAMVNCVHPLFKQTLDAPHMDGGSVSFNY